MVASGALEYLPFAALPLPGGAEGAPAVPLVAAHEVVAAPSAAAIAALRRETAGRAPAAKTLAIVADPVFEADYPRVARARPARAMAPSPAGGGRIRCAGHTGPRAVDAGRRTRRHP